MWVELFASLVRDASGDPAYVVKVVQDTTARRELQAAEATLADLGPLPPAERALIAMGVAALSSRAITRRGRLIKEGRRPG